MINSILKLYFPAIIWACVILYLSAFPGPQIELDLWLAQDKINHSTAYGLLSILIAWKNIKNQERLSRNFFLIVLITSGTYGILMEIMQYLFFPNRYFDYSDMVANLLGSFFGLIAVQIYCLNKK
jgi:VanZ family protein